MKVWKVRYQLESELNEKGFSSVKIALVDANTLESALGTVWDLYHDAIFESVAPTRIDVIKQEKVYHLSGGYGIYSPSGKS